MNSPVDVSFSRVPPAADQLSPFWAKRFGTAPFLPMSRAEMENRAGQLRHHPITGDAYAPPQLRHGRDRPCNARVCGLRALPPSRTGSADLWAGCRVNLFWGRDGGQHGSDDQPVHRRPENPQR